MEINQTAIDDESGEKFLISDIAYGKYDVVLETGPSYATQRQEAADLQMELLKVLGPEMANNIVHLIVKNLGVPGSEEVSSVLRKMLPDELKSEDEKMADLPAGVSKDPETEQLMKDGEPWEPEPTPEMILAQKQQEIDELAHKSELAKSEAKMADAQADGKQAEAKMAQAEADLAKAQAEMAAIQNPVQEGPDSGDMMTEIEQIITQTMEEHELNENAHKEATQEMITTAVVDALKRVKGFVDRKVKTDLGAVTKEEGPASVTTSSPANGGAAPAPAPAAPAAVILNVEPKPDRIDFKYDGDGQIVSAEPVYNDQRSDEQGEREDE